jgi:hypothetical protein
MGEPGDLNAVIESIPGRSLAAKLRQLLPLIDERIKSGVRLQDIVEALNRHGGLNAEVKASTLRSYVCRYRKAMGAPRLVDGAPSQETRVALVARETPPMSVSKVRNASDLKRLRNQEVDLDELSRIGKGQTGG